MKGQSVINVLFGIGIGYLIGTMYSYTQDTERQKTLIKKMRLDVDFHEGLFQDMRSAAKREEQEFFKLQNQVLRLEHESRERLKLRETILK